MKKDIPFTAEAVLALARDFMACRVLLTGAELELFTLLSPSSLTAEEIASRTGTNLRALTMLLDASAALGLLDKTAGRYSCPPPLGRLLSAGEPESMLPMVLHSAHLWHRWTGLTEIIRGTEIPRKMSPSVRNAGELRAFIEAMHVVAPPLARAIVDAVDTASVTTFLDVGGGPGTYTIAFVRAVPGMHATLFDLPDVVEIARRHVEEAGLLDRVTLVAGNFDHDELPGGHDLALLSAIIHQNSAGENLALFGKVRRALRPGGRIIIRDHVMESDRTHPPEGAMFAVNMLVATNGGGTYTFAEIEAGLREAGFTEIHLIKGGMHMDALVEARVL
jgi:3-hydroxy-5-methyl-1-naphthoate 3-O-methyltransferase